MGASGRTGAAVHCPQVPCDSKCVVDDFGKVNRSFRAVSMDRIGELLWGSNLGASQAFAEDCL
jgi:hypothetical protein